MGEQIDEIKMLETPISSNEQNPEWKSRNFDENPSGGVKFEQFNRKKSLQCDDNCSILAEFIGKSSDFDYVKYLDKTQMRSPRVDGDNDNYAFGGETLVDSVAKTLEKSIQIDGDNDNYALGGETLVDSVAKTLEKSIQVDGDNDNYALGGETLVDSVAKTLEKSIQVDGDNDNYDLGGETLVDGVAKTLEKSTQVDGDNDNYALGGETLVDGVAKTLEKSIQVDVDGDDGEIVRKPSRDCQVVDGDTLFAKTLENDEVGGGAVVAETLEKSTQGDVDGGGDTLFGVSVEESSKVGKLGGDIFVGETLEESLKDGEVGDKTVVAKALEKSSKDGEVGEKTLEISSKDGDKTFEKSSKDGDKTLEKLSKDGEGGDKILEKSATDGEVGGKTLEQSSTNGEVGGKTLEQSSTDGEVGGKSLENSSKDGEVGGKTLEKSLEDGEVGGVVVAKAIEKSLEDGEVGDGVVVAKAIEKSSVDYSTLFANTLGEVSKHDDYNALVDRFSKTNEHDSSSDDDSAYYGLYHTRKSYFETLRDSGDEDPFHKRADYRYPNRRRRKHCYRCGGFNGFCECHSGRMRPMPHLPFFPQDEYSPCSNYRYRRYSDEDKLDRDWRDRYDTHKQQNEPLSFTMWDEPECPVGAGLANMGNTCFLNSIVQCFIHTVPFVQGLQTIQHESSIHGEDDFCLLCAVCDQIELSLTSSGGSLRPLALVNNLNQISSFFQRYQQEDAHEFLQCFLDKLDSNWSEYERNTNEPSSSDNSVVKQVFGGRLVSQLHCNKCDHNSYTYEPLIDLSLGIEEADDVESALRCFTKVESIGDTEKFTCERCKEQVTGEKQFMLDQVPSVAAFHLKRFKSDGIVVEKIDKTVKYPLLLDLAPYTRGSTDRNEELKYELYAVVVHAGLSSTSGHYYCYIRTGPKSWYQFDDSKVHRVSEYHALNQDAYILFYTRKGIQWFSTFIEELRSRPKKEISSTSPKSVLDDTAQSCTSNCLEIVPRRSEAVHENFTLGERDGSHENDEDGMGRLKSEACSSSCLENTGDELCANDESACLKMEDKKPSAEKPMEIPNPNMKRKEVAKYLPKSSLHIGRRRFFGTVLTGVLHTKASSDKKRRKQVPYWLRRRSRKRAKFNPKHF